MSRALSSLSVRANSRISLMPAALHSRTYRLLAPWRHSSPCRCRCTRRHLSVLRNSTSASSNKEYSHTLQLPRTNFPVHWEFAQRERELMDITCQQLYAHQASQPLPRNGFLNPLIHDASQSSAAAVAADQGERSSNVVAASHLELDSEPRVFRLHDGPPFANGKLHCGHFLNKVLKDFINRHALQLGSRVDFRPGWDCHGLPIELKALEALKSDAQHRERPALNAMQIRDLARRFAQQAIQEQKLEFQRFGLLADWDRSYETMSREFEAMQIGVFASMFEQGLIYRGLKPVSWSPSSRTALAEAELEYNDEHISPSIHVLFPVTHLSLPSSLVSLSESPLFALIWTTTPWTMPANQAIAIKVELEYCIVQLGLKREPVVVGDSKKSKAEEFNLEGLRILIGKDRVQAIGNLVSRDVHVLATCTGQQLLGTVCRHPFIERDSPLIAASHVSTEAGTALVHTAPAHGADDFLAARAAGIDHCLNLVDDAGCFNVEASADLVGRFVLGEGNELCIQKLRAARALFHFTRFKHRYPYDWRSKTPVIERATWQWFARLDSLQELAVKALQQVEFTPSTGHARLASTVSSRNEWCISRQRCWGVPLPVFYNKLTGEAVMNAKSLRHVQTLFSVRGSDAWFTAPLEELLSPDLRDQAHLLERGTDTLDVWFDSGSSWGLQQREVDQFDMYLEGSDQHRGWFQSSLLLSLAVRQRAPYHSIVTHGFVLDEQRRKMSKSIGNIVEPRALIEQQSSPSVQPSQQKLKRGRSTVAVAIGADALRWWAASVDFRSDCSIGPAVLAKVTEVHRKLRTSLRFLLGNLGDFQSRDAVPLDQLAQVDLAMLHALHDLSARVLAHYQRHEFSLIYSAILSFNTHELSAFYFDVCKDRLYASGAQDLARRSCQTILAIALEVLLKAVAPLVPFTCEDVWQHMSMSNRSLVTSSTHIDACSVFLIGWIRPILRDVVPAMVVDAVHRVKLAREIKSHVSKSLELLRAQGVIGSSLEADVHLFIECAANRGHEWLPTSLHALGAELEAILVTSRAVVNVVEQPPLQAVEQMIESLQLVASASDKQQFFTSHFALAPPLPLAPNEQRDNHREAQVAIVVTRSRGCKCHRCWRFHHSSSIVSLCPRCMEVVLQRANSESSTQQLIASEI